MPDAAYLLVPQNASDFIAEALRGAFLSSRLGNYSKLVEEPIQPAAWETPLGMLLLPLLNSSLYDRIMTFLIALGIGALSGSVFFVMIPQAFHLPAFEQIDYISKSWLILSALYTFLVVDRLLQYMLEFRRVHASTLDKIMNGGEGGKKKWPQSRQTTEQTDLEAVSDENERKDREALKSELELSMLNNAFARAFSTRRRVAVLRPVEGIEYMEGGFSNGVSSPPLHRPRPVSPPPPPSSSPPPLSPIRPRAISTSALPCDSSPRPPSSLASAPSRFERSRVLTAEASILAARDAAVAEILERRGEEGGRWSRATSPLASSSATPQTLRTPTLGTRAASKVGGKGDRPKENSQLTRNTFVEEVNEEVQNQFGAFPPVASRRSSLVPPDHFPMANGKKRKADDEVSVSVNVVDKHIVDTSTVEVASVAYMIIFGSSANNFVDGMSMGAAFSDSLMKGLSIGVAVVSQQFPQELGTLAILINSGLGLRRTLLFNLIPTLLSFCGFVVGVLLDNFDDSYDTYIFAVSSGMYLYIFLGTLVPEIREAVNELIRTDIIESLIVTGIQTTGIATGIFFMYFMGQFNDIAIEDS